MDNNSASIISGTCFDNSKVFFSVKQEDDLQSGCLAIRTSEDVITKNNLKLIESDSSSLIDKAEIDSNKLQFAKNNSKSELLLGNNNDAISSNSNHLLKDNSCNKDILHDSVLENINDNILENKFEVPVHDTRAREPGLNKQQSSMSVKSSVSQLVRSFSKLGQEHDFDSTIYKQKSMGQSSKIQEDFVTLQNHLKLNKETEDITKKLAMEKYNRFDSQRTTRMECNTNYHEGEKLCSQSTLTRDKNDVVDGDQNNRKVERGKIKIPKFDNNKFDVGHENFFIKNLRKNNSQ